MSKKYCCKCEQFKDMKDFDGNKTYCKECITKPHVYYKDAPECPCGGKVVTAQEELACSSARDAHVWMCCSCGSVLGRYTNKGIGPEDIIITHERPDLSEK